METERLSTLEEVRLFVAGSAAVDFAGVDRGSMYEFTKRTLVRFDYGRLGKADKGLLRRYLAKATGLSRAQVTRLIRQELNATVTLGAQSAVEPARRSPHTRFVDRAKSQRCRARSAMPRRCVFSCGN